MFANHPNDLTRGEHRFCSDGFQYRHGRRSTTAAGNGGHWRGDRQHANDTVYPAGNAGDAAADSASAVYRIQFLTHRDPTNTPPTFFASHSLYWRVGHTV